MEMAVESMEMASGGTSPSRQGAKTEICHPKLRLTTVAAAELFVDGGRGI